MESYLYADFSVLILFFEVMLLRSGPPPVFYLQFERRRRIGIKKLLGSQRPKVHK